MSRIHISVNDTTVTPRTGDLPSLADIQTSLQNTAGGEFKPWIVPTIQALGITMAPMLAGRTIPDTTITITTSDNEWTLNVRDEIAA